MLRLPLALALVLVVLAITAATAAAKGQIDRIVIEGPGIRGSATLTGSGKLDDLSIGRLEDMNSVQLERPGDLPASARGYLVTRYWADASGSFIPFDRIRYFRPQRGAPGYIYHVSSMDSHGGLAARNWYDSRWIIALARGDLAMRRTLARVVVHPKPRPAAATGAWIYAAIGALALVAAGLGTRRRTRRRQYAR